MVDFWTFTFVRVSEGRRSFFLLENSKNVSHIVVRRKTWQLGVPSKVVQSFQAELEHLMTLVTVYVYR